MIAAAHWNWRSAVQTSNTLADAVLAYALGFYAMISSHSEGIVGLLGFILVLAKLVQELPKAWEVLCKKDKHDRDY